MTKPSPMNGNPTPLPGSVHPWNEDGPWCYHEVEMRLPSLDWLAESGIAPGRDGW